MCDLDTKVVMYVHLSTTCPKQTCPNVVVVFGHSSGYLIVGAYNQIERRLPQFSETSLCLIDKRRMMANPIEISALAGCDKASQTNCSSILLLHVGKHLGRMCSQYAQRLLRTCDCPFEIVYKV